MRVIADPPVQVQLDRLIAEAEETGSLIRTVFVTEDEFWALQRGVRSDGFRVPLVIGSRLRATYKGKYDIEVEKK